MTPLTTDQARLYRAWLEARAEALALNMLICEEWFQAAVKNPDGRRVAARVLVDALMRAFRERMPDRDDPMTVSEEVWHESFHRGIGRALDRLGDPSYPRAAVATEGNRLWIP